MEPHAIIPEQRFSEQESRPVDTVAALKFYNDQTDVISSPQRLSLSDDEFLDAMSDERVIMTQVQIDATSVDVPVLVPTEKLYWYNQPVLKKLFGDKDVHFYNHLPMSPDLIKTVGSFIIDGSIVILSEDDHNSGANLAMSLQATAGEDTIVYESLHGAFLNQYGGEVFYYEDQQYKIVPGFVETFNRAVTEGIIEFDPFNGAEITGSITGEEAEKLWSLYEKPFMDISTTSPINAGFDKEGFMEALQDESTVKVINRADGEITTLALFGTDISHASWLNEAYFQAQFPEAHSTNNILLFTGIVSDETKRGNAYGADLMNLLLKVGEIRGSKGLITFECNEVSSEYLPIIVNETINQSGLAKVTNLNNYVSQSRFSYITSKNPIQP